MSGMKQKESGEEKSVPSRNVQIGELKIDVLAILRRRVVLLVASGIVGVLLAACYLFLVPSVYESTSQILLMENQSGAMASNMNGSDKAISEDLLATHMSLLQSNRIVSNALRNNGLDQLPSIVDQIDDGSASDFVINSLYVTRGGVGTARQARVLTLAFRHNNPEDCQLVTRAILDEYRAFVTSKFQDINKEAVELINKARIEIDHQIKQLNVEYQQFRASSPLLASTEGGANVHAMRFEELSSELSKVLVKIDESRVRLELVKKQMAVLGSSEAHSLQKLALIDEENAQRLGILVTVERGEAQTASFQALQPERVAGAQTEYNSLLALKSELSRAMDDYGPLHPNVLQLQAQVREIEKFIFDRQGKLGLAGTDTALNPDDVMAAYMGLLANDLAGLEQRKINLEKQISEAETDAKKLVEYELKNEELVREMTRQGDLYSSVVERLRDINMQQDSSGLIQEVLQEPEVGTKVSPNAKIAAVIALLTAMLLGGASIAVAEIFDKRVHSAVELEEVFGARILAHIADFDSNTDAKKAIASVRKAKGKVDPALFAFHDPAAKTSEAFRTIRTELMFALPGSNRAIAFTSPSQGDGKSTNAANVAVSLAKTGKSVVLVDADMRRPNIHKIFGLSNNVGLADYLGGEVDFQKVLNPGPCDNLLVAVAGKNATNASELLSGPRFSALLAELREQYDYVIVDCPPLLPVSDPAIIAPLVDGVVLVVVPSKLNTHMARECQRILDSKRAVTLGIIVNRTGSSSSAYAYLGYYDNEYTQEPEPVV